MSTSREDSRAALKALLTTALVGTGLPVKTVTDSKVKTLNGLTPLVSILSAGTLRERATFMGDIPTFELEVQVWVRQADTGWTNAQAEDALDDIESRIAQVYEDNRGGSGFSSLQYADTSIVMEVSVGGKPFYLERIPTIAKLARS